MWASRCWPHHTQNVWPTSYKRFTRRPGRLKYAVCMNKARYAKSRWWVAASALGAFVAMFGALFASDRDADTVDALAPVSLPVTQPAPATNRGVRPSSQTQQSTRNVQPAAPSTQP